MADVNNELVDLLPCPFCGGDPQVLRVGNNGTKSRKVTIKCPDCRVQRTDAALRFSMQWLEDRAIDQWNRRSYWREK